MENATQALMIAVGVLIGLLLLSLGVYLFNMISEYAGDTERQMSQTSVAQFNDKFLKNNGLTNLTIQDVITIKNYASDVNSQEGTFDNGYVEVNFTNSGKRWELATQTIFEKNDEELLKDNADKTFGCHVEIDTTIGKVNKVYFYKTSE